VDPARTNVVGPVTAMVHRPFAATFPVTPAIATDVPVESPCGLAVVIMMGTVFDAAATAWAIGVHSTRLAPALGVGVTRGGAPVAGSGWV
jgi:hypothetical protein